MPNANRHIYPNMYIAWNGVEITDDYLNLSWDSSAELIEKTAGTETDKSYIVGRRDNTVTLSMADSGTTPITGTTVASRIMYAGNSGTLEWAPEGTAADQRKYQAIFAVESVSTPYESLRSLAMKDASLRMNDAWIDNYDISGDVYP